MIRWGNKDARGSMINETRKRDIESKSGRRRQRRERKYEENQREKVLVADFYWFQQTQCKCVRECKSWQIVYDTTKRFGIKITLSIIFIF